MADNAIVPYKPMFPDVGGAADPEMLEELAGIVIRFDRVKVPAGGGLAFTMPEGYEPAAETALVGVIVDHHRLNAYWPQKYNGAGTPPQCLAPTAVHGIGDPGVDCNLCPLNKFGSAAEGSGKACKNLHRVYLLREGARFPILLTLPPTSMPPYHDYVAKTLVANGYRACDVATRITLKQVRNAGGIAYSQCVFAVAGTLSDEDTQRSRAFARQIKVMTRDVPVIAAEAPESTRRPARRAPLPTEDVTAELADLPDLDQLDFTEEAAARPAKNDGNF